MSNTGLYFYKLISKYPDDQTLNCKLSINQIDSNFEVLKDNDIKSAEFVQDKDESGNTYSSGTLIITKNDGEKIIVPINTTINKNFTYDFHPTVGIGDEGGTDLTLNFKDDDGEHTLTIKNILTVDNLHEIIGSDILTKVITDNTLKGLGTMSSPLGLAGVERTGMYAPAITLKDLTDWASAPLPDEVENGTRYVTKEKVNDYGYLYNGNGVKKIQELLDLEYNVNEVYKEVKHRDDYWHVPSKEEWDKLLNSVEPCEYRNHNSAACHVELGKVAGKYLKSACGWVWQEDCLCAGERIYTSCTPSDESDEETFDDVHDPTDVNPSDSLDNESKIGIDKYGMRILPSGVAIWKNGAKYSGFKETAVFWTTTSLGEGQDTYAKVFDYDRGGVWQVAECPDAYYSVRLVKNFDGSNFREAEYIDGVLYKAILMPESGQIWLASNFADKKGFVKEGKDAEVLPVNDGHVLETRTEMFLNEYNGRYWEKKVMNEGDTIVIQETSFDPDAKQKNLEYRVYVENCDKYLKNTDDLITERILDIVIPLIDEERDARISGDTILQYEIDELSAYTISAITDLEDALEEERQIRESADTEIWDAIDAISSATTEFLDMLSAETEARIEGDEILSGAIEDERAEREAVDDALSGAIDTEREERISADTALDEKIDAETERAKEREDEIDGQLIDWSKNPYTMTASASTENLILESKDGNEDHFIKIKFDGNFGEI